jgi:hypothetical protein
MEALRSPRNAGNCLLVDATNTPRKASFRERFRPPHVRARSDPQKSVFHCCILGNCPLPFSQGKNFAYYRLKLIVICPVLEIVFFRSPRFPLEQEVRTPPPPPPVCPLLYAHGAVRRRHFPIFSNKQLNIFYSNNFKIMSRL